MKNDNLMEIRISVVCPWFFWGDAVGHCAFEYYKALKDIGFKNVRGIGTRNDFPDLIFENCTNLEELENNTWFNESDLVIYHFAIYHEYFDILKKQKNGKHVICFHNVTPKQFTPKSIWHIIDKSFEQIALFKHADAIWVDSRENEEELKRQGIIDIPITEIPIAVERPQISTIFEKSSTRIDLLYVGRFFPSKGVTDLIDAIAMLKKDTLCPFLLRLVGNTDFSDANYINEVKSKIKLHGLGEYVDFVGKVDESTLANIYKTSHIFVTGSYHEGFCVPVIEALRAGMIPVTYTAGNLRWIAGSYGITVDTGDIESFSISLHKIIDELNISFKDPDTPILSLDNGSISARQFSKNVAGYVDNFTYVSFCKHIQNAVVNLF